MGFIGGFSTRQIGSMEFSPTPLLDLCSQLNRTRINDAVEALLNDVTALPSLYWGYTLALLLALIIFVQRAKTWCRLKHIPGPFWDSLTKHWQIVTQFKGNWYLDLKRLTDEYGDLVRIGPNQLMTTDVNVIRRMGHPKSSYSRTHFYQTFRFIPGQDSSFTLLDDQEHNRRRTKLGRGYAGNVDCERHVDGQCARLINLIERKFVSTAADYKPLNLTSITHLFAMDVISDLSFGRAIGCLDEGEDLYDFVRQNNKFFQIALIVCNFQWLVKLLSKPPFKWFLLPSTRDEKGAGKYLSLVTEAVEERFNQTEKQRNDALGAFIEHGVTKEEAINELTLQIVAGTDTTATAIRITLLYLVATPSVYIKLRSELDNAIASGAISSPIKDIEARKLSYLQAVIKEGLRVFPVVTATFFKKVPKGGDVVSGYFVPEGTEIGHNVYGIMRARKYWGDDAEVFRPERWLEADGETYEMMSEALETLWGAGRFKCLGRTIAQLELNKVLVELLRRFDFAVAEPQNGIKIINSAFFLMSDLKMRLTRRTDI